MPSPRWPSQQGAQDKTIASARAQQLAVDTGALLYWLPAEEVVTQIEKDIETFGRIGAMLAG